MKNRINSLALLPLLLLLPIAQAQTAWTVGQTVNTTSGPVSGHAASVHNDVSVYLGIPFAIPPVGDLRWTEPQAYNSSTPLNGSDYGYSCPQFTGIFGGGNFSNIANVNLAPGALAILSALGSINDKVSEDCLTLNVWTNPQTTDSKKAVLVWIYGGDFVEGTSANNGTDGQYLVEEQDLVVVTLNYRLNVFGFPGVSGGNGGGVNLGLLDQRLAVEWVRDNIAGFGGDVDRIILAGQSAGAASVDYYTFAWTADPIIAGAIPESGTAQGLPVQVPVSANSSFYALAEEVGCSGSDLACMRKVDIPTLIKAIGTTNTSFGPTQDDKVVFTNYTAKALAGDFIKKPLLIGNTDYEAGIFNTLYSLDGVEANMNYWDSFDDDIFDCPAAIRANMSISNNVPTWRYRWFGAFPNTELTTSPFSGAWHASEVPLLFNTTPTTPVANTPEEIEIGKYFRGAWAAFAKDPEKGLLSYDAGWPLYDPSKDTLAQLAYDNTTGPNLIHGDIYDGLCPYYRFGVYTVDLAAIPTATLTPMSSTIASIFPTYTPSGNATSNGTLPQNGTIGTGTASSAFPQLTPSGNATSNGTLPSNGTMGTGTAASGSGSTTSAAAGPSHTLSTADLSEIATITGKIPKCALVPLSEAIAASGCGLADYYCQCTTGYATIQSVASPKVLMACSTADGMTTASLTAQICKIASPNQLGVPSSTTNTASHATDIAGVLATATPGQCISANKICAGVAWGVDWRVLFWVGMMGVVGVAGVF